VKGSPFEREEEAALHQPIIREGEVSFRGDDEMVQHREFQQFAQFQQLAGEADVHLGRFEVAAGVVDSLHGVGGIMSIIPHWL